MAGENFNEAGDLRSIRESVAALAAADSAQDGPTATSRIVSSAASTNATRAKATAGVIERISGNNTTGGNIFLKTYDSAADPPVPGTTTIRNSYTIPPGVFVIDGPASHATGIGYALFGAAGGADAATTAVAAGDVLNLNVEYR